MKNLQKQFIIVRLIQLLDDAVDVERIKQKTFTFFWGRRNVVKCSISVMIILLEEKENRVYTKFIQSNRFLSEGNII